VKKPAAPTAAAPTPASPPAAAEKKEPAAAAPATPSAPASAAAATPAKPAAASPSPAGAAPSADMLGEASMMVSQEEAQQMITNLCEMGFPRDQVILALRASYFNPHRAVEYLFSGNIPVTAPVAPTPARPAAPASPAAVPSTPATASTPAAAPAAPARPQGNNAPNPFDFLRQHPQFGQMRDIARQDPSRLEDLLTAMAQSNPDMIPLIADHQDDFIRLLTSDDPAPAAGGGGGGGFGPGSDPRITPGPRPGTVQVQVTQQDMDAINNLVAMGFDRNRALEAYIVFGRNVDAAANYLLTNPDDDPMDFQGAGGDYGGFDGDDGDEGEGDEGEGPTDF